MNKEPFKKLVEVSRVSDRVMSVVAVFREDVLKLIYGYAPQSGRCLEEEQSFCDGLKCELDVHSACDLSMCLSDFNGHAGRHVDGFNGIYGGYGIAERNLEGRMLLEFCLEKDLCVKYMI